MNQDRLSKLYQFAVIGIGVFCLILALFNLPKDVFSWNFLLLLGFTILIVPRISIQLPRTKFVLSFSDSIIFLALVIYGGGAAILLAAVENLAHCFYLRGRGAKLDARLISFNVGSAVLSTALTYAAWLVFLDFSRINLDSAQTVGLISAFGFLAITQFVGSSVIVAIPYSIKTGASLWRVWKRDCLLSAMTQIGGASLALVVFNLFYDANFLATGIVFSVVGIIYFCYRRTIKDINQSIEQVRRAEREKAEIAGLKAEEAKNHAAELESLLAKEERISHALLQSRDALEHAAFHDFLTDLPNRTYLIERLNLLIEIGIEISHKYYVLFLDLKRFKNINDSLGHNVGDRVLKLVGKRLTRLLRKEDTIARLGGDEFAIVLNDLSSLDEAREIAEQIYEKLASPFLINGNRIYSDLNIGIAPFDVEHKNPEDVLRDADIAMHHAKATNCGVGVFDKNLRARHLEKITLEAELRFAVERGELSMHYQPLVSLQDGELVGFEALLRWHHHELGSIPPVKFIPIAEDSGLIVPITKWILRETCAQLAKWQQISAASQKLLVSVNISGKHLTDVNLVRDVQRALKTSGLTAESLKLEITESAAMENAEQSISILNGLKGLGVRLSIDDFGTGYSSLSYLHRLPFDSLKVDRSFVNEVGTRGENSKVLQTIVALAKNLKMRIFAEGIETESQLAILQNLGCDYGQGYLISRPLPRDAMEKLLYQKRDWLPFGICVSGTSDESDVKEENLPVF